MSEGNAGAPEGQVWVCGACGKRSRSRYGLDGMAIDRGRDESCMLNAVLCFEEKNENGSWQAVPEEESNDEDQQDHDSRGQGG